MIHITSSQTDTILSVIHEDEFWSDSHIKKLSLEETFYFETFADRPFAQYLTDRNRVIIPNEDRSYSEFIIEETEQVFDRTKIIHANASYIELRKQKVVDPQTLQGQTASTAAKFALSGTKWKVGDVLYTTLRTIIIDKHMDAYSLIKLIASTFDLELNFRVEVEGNKVVGRYVDLVEKVGTWAGREAVFGADLIGVKRIEKTDEIVTALIGLGPEKDDGTRLEVFVEDKEALQRWGYNGQHLVEIYEPQSDNQSMTLAELRKLTENALKKRINSLVEYESTVANLEAIPGLEHHVVRFGDTIRIKDEGFFPPLYLEARIHTQERSIKEEREKSFVLGDYIEYTQEDVMALFYKLKGELQFKASTADVDQAKKYAEQVATQAETNAKEYAVDVAVDEAALAEARAKDYADKIKVDDSKFPDNVPPKPTLQATGLFKKVLLEWDAVFSSYMAYYEIYAGTAAGFTPSAENLVDKVPSGNYVFEGNVNTTYYFKIRGVNRAGTAGPYSDEVSASTVDLNPDDFDESKIPEFIDQGIIKQDTEPAGTSYAVGQLWIDTSKNPNIFWRWNGSSWDKLAPTSAAEVGTYTSTQIDNALNAKASKTVVDGIADTVSDHETRITQNTDQIQLRVTKTEFENLQVGGRNLHTETTNEFREVHWSSWNVYPNGTGYAIPVVSGETYTASVYYKDVLGIDVTLRLFWVKDGSTEVVESTNGSIVKDGEEGYSTITRVAPEGVSFVKVVLRRASMSGTGSAQYKGIKFEKGNKATDWSPAPEDTQGLIDSIDARLSTAESSITQNAGQIALKVSQTTYDLDVGNLKTRMTSAESSITQHADQIALKVEKNGVISSINQTAESIKINASKVQIDGDLTVTNGLVRIKDGIITNKMIASNALIDGAKIGEIDAGKLKAGSIIAQDITFKGNLQGATGSFNGNLSVSGSGGDTFIDGEGIRNTVSRSSHYQTVHLGLGILKVSDTGHPLELKTNNSSIVIDDNTITTGIQDSASILFNRRASGIVDIELAPVSIKGSGDVILGGSVIRLNAGNVNASGNITAGASITATGMLSSHGVTSTGFIKTTKTEEALILDTPLSAERSYLRFKKAGVSKGYFGSDASSDDMMLYSYNGVLRFKNGIMINSEGTIARFMQSDSNYWAQSSTIAGVYFGGSIKHSFRSDGTKAGGSIEIEGQNLGMSPIDSPQILLEYIDFDIPLSEQGVRVYIEPRFRKGVANFAVFPNNGTIIEKGYDYFVIAGTGTADCRIVGERVDYDDVFWANMDSLSETKEEPTP